MFGSSKLVPSDPNSFNISGSKENVTVIDSSVLQFMLKSACQNSVQLPTNHSVVLDPSILTGLTSQNNSSNVQKEIVDDPVAPIFEEYEKNDFQFKESVSQPVILVDYANENLHSNESSDSPRKKRKLDDNIEEPTNTHKSLNSNYVYKVLSGCGEGQLLLEAYQYQQDKNNLEKLLKEKKILYFKPSKVAKIIIFHEFHVTKTFTISNERFEKLANDGVEIFPIHIIESFYYGPTPSKCPDGALYNSYLKIREKYQAIGRIKTEKVINTEIKKCKLPWLQELGASVDVIDEDYVKYWTNTSLLERTCWYKKSSLSEIFDKLPSLSNSDGYRLLVADYEQTFTFTSESFKKNLKALSPFIIDYSKSKVDLQSRSKTAREQYKREIEGLLSLLSQNTVVQTGSEHETVLALMVLPYIFKRTTKIFGKKDRTPWTPTFQEISKSFIYHVQESDDEEQSLNDVRTTLLDIHNTHTVPLNGYIVVFGPTISRILSSYVIISKTTYKVKSVVDAVAICFQALHILGKEFNRACNHVWLFIEKKIFCTNTKTSFSNVSAVIEDIQMLQNVSKPTNSPRL